MRAKTIKKAGIAIGVLISILLIAAPVFEHYVAKRLLTILPDVIFEKTHGAYQISIEGVDVSVWSGSIALQGLDIIPNEPKARETFALMADVSFETITLSGLNYWRFLTQNEVLLREIRIQQPKATLSSNPNFKALPASTNQAQYTFDFTQLIIDSCAIQFGSTLQKQTLHIGHLQFDKPTGNLNLHTVALSDVRKKSTGYDSLKISANQLQLEGLKTEPLLNNQTIEFTDAFIQSPVFKIHQAPRDSVVPVAKSKSFPFKINLNSIKTLTLSRAQLYYSTIRNNGLYTQLMLGIVHGSYGNENFNFSNIRFIPYISKDDQRNRQFLLEVDVPNLALDRFNLGQFHQNKRLSFDTLLMENAHIKLIKTGHVRKTQRDSSNTTSLNLPLAIEQLHIKNSTFEYRHLHEPKPRYRAGSIHIQVETFNTDSTGIYYAEEFGSFNQLSIQLTQNYIQPPQSLYRYEIDTAYFSTQDSTADLTGIRLLPHFDKKEFGQKLGRQTDCASLTVPSARLRGCELWRFLSNDQLFAQSLHLYQPQLSLYRDKNVKFKTGLEKEMPQELLRNLAVDFYLDSVCIQDGNIVYEEQEKGTLKVGAIFFSEVHGTITRITSIPEQYMQGEPMRFVFKGKLMNKSTLQFEAEMPIGHPRNYHTLKGSLTETDFVDMNPFFKNTLFVEAQAGTASKLTFNFKADSEESHGTLHAQYSGLKVKVLKKNFKDEDTSALGKRKYKPLFSQLMNGLIRTENPENGFEKVGTISFTRNTSRFIINYWVKSILSGLTTILIPDYIEFILEQNKKGKVKRKRKNTNRPAIVE